MLQLLRKIAFPFSLLYAFVIYARNWFYDIGFFKSTSFQTPTICIGNLTVGGTGKTPMIEYLVNMLSDQHLAVLSRGYKRKSAGFILAGEASTVSDLGDEPYQLYHKFPKLVVAVDANRRNGIAQLEALVKPDVILLDDAFQHRKVKPSYSILLTTYDNLYASDWYLPTGNLRDAKREARRADLIIVTKCPTFLNEEEKLVVRKKLDPKPNQSVLFGSLAYAEKIKNGHGLEISPSELNGKKLALVTGIAKPAPFVAHIKGLGVSFEHLEYGDHHDFTAKEIEIFKTFDLILTTEKDFVRLDGKLQHAFYLEVAHAFTPGDRKILDKEIGGLIGI